MPLIPISLRTPCVTIRSNTNVRIARSATLFVDSTNDGCSIAGVHGIAASGGTDAGHFWLASTRVEKWNDVAVADRCKPKGMSGTVQGVLAVALYAAKKTHTNT